MDQIELILERLKENEEIQRKFYALESKILSILNFKDFFEILLTEMKNIFRIPYVWLSVIEESNLAGLIERVYDSEIICERTNFIRKSDFDKIFGHVSVPVLVNHEISRFSNLFPKNSVYPMQSLAVSPVQIDGEVVGSLNQGDIDAGRFEPDMDTSSLEQLMLKISLCLSNVSAHEKLHYFAYHDPLSGLLNRRAFEALLHREFSRSKRHGSNLSLIFLDLDAFKQINDRFGHDAGDMVLQYIADTLESISREEDLVARFAGDEFVIILPETSINTAETLMMRVQDHLNHHPLTYNGISLSISLSYGISSSEEAGISRSDLLLKKADDRLYREKAGKEKKEQVTQN